MQRWVEGFNFKAKCLMFHFDGVNKRYIRTYLTFCIKTYVFVISDNIQLVNLPLPTDGNFVGEMATVSGWGRTEQSKCIATLNWQSDMKNGYYTVGATWIRLKLHKIM
jgi:hypothetical protein